jgi:hypothetical protein
VGLIDKARYLFRRNEELFGDFVKVIVEAKVQPHGRLKPNSQQQPQKMINPYVYLDDKELDLNIDDVDF